MHKKFDSEVIEREMQKRWEETGIYNVGLRDASKEKEYVLVEWPYPSGNLHIGHWYAFAVPDIYVRYKRMLGKQVIYPMGFDAFGLPAENAAIKRNLNPKNWTNDNIAYMRDQLRSMGNAFSWDKTCNSTDPEYYKWTQWMFTKFFENDIAYRGKGIVNWCPGCNTVIANEQVLADGTCERSGDLIEKKEMPQWMFRITKYADRLTDDLDALDWPEHIKEAQRQWIGRSKGATIDFKLSVDETVTVFTTRPDTLFGATFLVLAPEHPLVLKHKDSIKNWAEAEAYINVAKQKDEQDRLDATKEKTGVKLDGITATNPASGEEVPVFIADYVLAGYGTGAIMAVPAHDERDFAFAERYGVDIKYVIKPDLSLPYSKLREGYPGGIDNAHLEGETFEESIERNRLATIQAINDAITNSSNPWLLGGEIYNSGEFDGMDSEEAKEAIVKKVSGKMSSTYRLRDWSIGRQRYWGVPIPIVYDPEGKAHAIPEEHLPWALPEDVDFKPTGEAPLAKSEALKQRTEEIFGKGWTPEVETMDTFVDSSWYFLRYIDNHNSDVLSSLEAQKTWMPIDIYFGGAEHTTMHLLYSRFWQKALFDLGLVAHDEPYKRRINRGLVLGPDGNKMSKSKGNVIDPDEQVKLVGSDSVKMYLAFLGPFEGSNYPFDLSGIAGVRRFLERVFGLTEHLTENEPADTTRLLHKTIAKVRGDIEGFKFNTAISAMMIFVNQAEKYGLNKASYLTFIKLLAPFAPHLTDHIWGQEGNRDSIHLEVYPEADPSLLKDTEITLGVQVNGKLRGTITLAPDATEETATNLAFANPDIQRYVEGKTPKKVVYVPGKILSLIIG
jgi:leucyl-tRNA synthetase